jgi:NAD(P)-dependent dehydrogenase (short-subunit alcohol dehydrogenase family)
MRSYGQSKLANLLFTYELQRRLAAAVSPVSALAAHPGASATELERDLPLWMAWGRWLPHQSAARGETAGFPGRRSCRIGSAGGAAM